MSEEIRIPAIWHSLSKLVIALGAHPLHKHAACYELQLDERWWIAANGHRDARLCSKGPSVPPFGLYVTYNGWPAGIIELNGGSFAAGTGANEESFIEAIELRLKNVLDTAHAPSIE